MKQIYLSTILLAIFLLTNVNITAQEQKKTTSVNINSEELFEKLMSSFNPNWKVEEPAPTDYPTYYGGSFIDNNGKFVVCVVGNPAQHRPTISSILGTNDFLTETCTYSYREMMQVMDKIDAFLSNSSIPATHPFLTYFAGTAADVFENRVVVRLTEMNDVAIQAFKRDISNSPVVMFEKGEMPVM
ncbi:MAG: hypothetical protein Q4G63_04660 [Bacteroidia bacterium]|nr:hypothetical protein [Bacteroidia bacterium]